MKAPRGAGFFSRLFPAITLNARPGDAEDDGFRRSRRDRSGWPGSAAAQRDWPACRSRTSQKGGSCRVDPVDDHGHLSRWQGRALTAAGGPRGERICAGHVPAGERKERAAAQRPGGRRGGRGECAAEAIPGPLEEGNSIRWTAISQAGGIYDRFERRGEILVDTNIFVYAADPLAGTRMPLPSGSSRI